MSKIFLIKPRFFHNFMLEEVVTQPMGLLYIGATLQQAGHEVMLHDCALDHEDLHILRQKIFEWEPDVIGISVIITEVEASERIMKVVREILPDVVVVFGGPWPSSNPEESVKRVGADFVVIGEGELVFPQLIDAVNKGLPIGSLPGIAFQDNDDIRVNERRFLTEDELNFLPFPAWNLLDRQLYAKMTSMPGIGRRPYMAVVTSRGCPYRCAYCHQTMGKVFRKRSAESVITELEELRFTHGVKDFEILDDIFNLDHTRMQTILAGIRDRIGDARLHFPNAVRADLLAPEDIDLFKQAGTITLFFAIETASPRIQKMVHKNLNIEKASRAIDASVKAGIYSTGYFMIGFPTETYEEALATVKFAARSMLHRALFFKPIPFPGTELELMAADVLESKKYILDPRVIHYYTNELNISAIPNREWQKIYQHAYRRFYLNPRRMFRIMKLIMRRPEIFPIKRIAGMFLRTFFPKRRIA